MSVRSCIRTMPILFCRRGRRSNPVVVRWARIIECDSLETTVCTQKSSELYDRRLYKYIIANLFPPEPSLNATFEKWNNLLGHPIMFGNYQVIYTFRAK